MKIASRKKLFAVPVGFLLSAAVGISAEICGIPFLVPIAFLMALLTVAYVAPALAVVVGDMYGLRAKRDVRYSLVAGALRYRSSAIGASSLLLFVVSAIIAIGIGLIGAGIGEVSQGKSYWKEGYRWGVIADEHKADVDAVLTNGPGHSGTYSQARMRPQPGVTRLPRNAFIMDCAQYAAASTDAMTCPQFSGGALYVPADIDEKVLSNEILFPAVSRDPVIVRDAPIVRVPGLTEILISPELVSGGAPVTYVYLSPEVSDAEAMRLASFTKVGFSSQESIDARTMEMRQGYMAIARYLYVILVFFGLAIIVAQSSSAIFDRRRLLNSMLLRGFEENIGRRLILLETSHLSLPYIFGGYALGVAAGFFIAAMSSMDSSKVLNYNLVASLVILVVSAVLFPAIQLRLMRVKT